MTDLNEQALDAGCLALVAHIHTKTNRDCVKEVVASYLAALPVSPAPTPPSEPLAKCDYCDDGKITYGGHDGDDEAWQEDCTHCHGTGSVKAAPRTVPPSREVLTTEDWEWLKYEASSSEMAHLYPQGLAATCKRILAALSQQGGGK